MIQRDLSRTRDPEGRHLIKHVEAAIDGAAINNRFDMFEIKGSNHFVAFMIASAYSIV